MENTDQQRLMQAALAHVPFDGMNDRALAAGAREAGIAPKMIAVYFPRGGADLAAAYHRQGDAQLAEWLSAQARQGRFRDRITAAVRQRISQSDREIVRAAGATLALPIHGGLSLRLLWETADTIWTGLGDTSRDVNWCSKRATLAAVIGSTVLFWLGDESPDQAHTWEFLDRRIDDVMAFEGVKARMRKWQGMSAVTDLATRWIHAPESAELPGRVR